MEIAGENHSSVCLLVIPLSKSVISYQGVCEICMFMFVQLSLWPLPSPLTSSAAIYLLKIHLNSTEFRFFFMCLLSKQQSGCGAFNFKCPLEKKSDYEVIFTLTATSTRD